jgi:hypothetical protein
VPSESVASIPGALAQSPAAGILDDVNGCRVSLLVVGRARELAAALQQSVEAVPERRADRGGPLDADDRDPLRPRQARLLGQPGHVLRVARQQHTGPRLTERDGGQQRGARAPVAGQPCPAE